MRLCVSAGPVVAFILASGLGGCAGVGNWVAPKIPLESSVDHRFDGRVVGEELKLLKAERPALGIALSGGGLRASYYSFGALKALYDKGLLQRANLISSVSGGGYTAYWLYTGQADAHWKSPATKLEFGSARLSPENFGPSFCEMVANANFVTLPAMLGRTALGQAIPLYHRRIGRVFGDKDPYGAIRMADLRPLVERDFPYLIVNATVHQPPATGWYDGLYEFTPVGTRTGQRGEVPWLGGQGVPFRQAVAISGAAFAPFLKQTIAEPPQGGEKLITLHDGGGSENLGAIALIRRGVKTIIIIDAEHDPAYKFGAYAKLQKRLRAWGGTVTSGGIDPFVKGERRGPPERSYFMAEASLPIAGAQQTSTIHYFKMSLPTPHRTELFKRWDGAHAQPDFYKFAGDMAHSFDRETRTYNCDIFRGRTLPLIPFSEYAVAQYGRWWNNTLRARLPLGDASLNFPQYTTFDQSMYLNQAPAFIGLGYLQAFQFDEKKEAGLDAIPRQ